MGINTQQTPQCTNSANLFVQVDYPINGGQIGYDQTICEGDAPASLQSISSPTGGTGTYTYQWGWSTNGTTYFIIPGATDETYSPGPLTQSTYFVRFAYSEPCNAGASNSVLITVNQKPVITSGTTFEQCSGQTFIYNPTSNNAYTTYTWTASSPTGNVTGFSISGSGEINDVLSLQPGSSTSGQVVYTLTPTGPAPTYCLGDPVNITVNVYATPQITNSVTSETICSGESTAGVIFNSNVPGTTYTWTASAPSSVSGYQFSGSGNLPSWTLYSISLVQEIVDVYVYPEGPSPAHCAGDAFHYQIFVNPSPTVSNSPLSQAICNGETTTEVILTSNVLGTTFNWTATADPPSLTGWVSAGTSTIPAQTIYNPTNSNGTVTYHINPSGSFGGCAPAPRDYVITVGPTPHINSSLSGTVCSGSIFQYSISSDVLNCSYTWNRPLVQGITPATSSGINPNISETLYNSTPNTINTTYQITPTGPAPLNCPGEMAEVVVAVKPQPVVNAGPDKTIPFGTSTQLTGSASSESMPVSVDWQPIAKIASPNNQLIVHTTNLYANTEFTLHASDNAGCEANDQVWVYLSGSALMVAPSAELSVICAGDATTLHANASGGSGNYTYSWSPSIGLNSTTSPDVVASPPVTTTYTVTVNDGYNTVSGQVTVEVIPTPQAYNVSGGGEFCAGTNGVTINLSNSEPGVEYFLLLNGNPLNATQIFGNGGALAWNNINTPGTYGVMAQKSGCPGSMNGSALVTELPLPTPFTLTGGGSYPQGGVGVPIGLSGSEVGFEYYLVLVGTGTISTAPVIGTGGPISFGLQTQAGSYQVIGKNPNTSCVTYMSGTVSVSINPTPTVFNMTGGGEGCENTPGVEVGLSGSEIGINYYLYANNQATGEVFPGTGLPLSFGPRPAGQYTCKAYNPSTGIWIDMVGVAVVTLNPNPLVFSVVPNGAVCPGVEIRLNGSEAGVDYTLFRDGLPVKTIMGTGSFGFLSFGSFSTPGFYTVSGVNSATGCQETMNGSTHIQPLPNVYNVIPAGILCSGEAVELSGSENGIYYQLRLFDSVNIGNPIIGNGQPLNFGAQNYQGIYKVYAYNPVTLCWVWMNGQAYLDTLPTSYSITPSGNFCGPVEIGLNGSQPGYTYFLYLDGLSPALATLVGTGSPLNFGSYYSSGVYTITAKDEFLHCETPMLGQLTLHQSPLAYMVMPQGINCAPAEVSLSLSESGVQYQLFKNGSPTVPPTFVQGTGASLSLGIWNEGVYTVEATNSEGCVSMMQGYAVLLPGPEVDAGPDGFICETETFQPSALAAHCAYVQWQTTGDGSFNLSNQITTVYTPGPNDILNGSVQLILKGYAGNNCPGVYHSDTLLLTIHSMPQLDAGPDKVSCRGASIQISSAQASGYQFLYWTTTGDGTFDDPSLVNPTYNPGNGDKANGSVVLKVFATGVSSCSAWYLVDSLILTIINAPEVNAGNDQSICSGDQVYLSASVQNYTNLQWTTSGNGSFSNPFIPNPVYSPGPMDIIVGSVTLILHAYRNSQQCSTLESSDTLVITIVPMASVNAGGSAQVCEDGVYQTQATANYASSYHWTTSGDGSFINPYSLNTVYQPGPNDKTNQQVVLTLTAHGLYGCSIDSVSSNLLLTITPLPAGSAGDDGWICASGTFSPAASANLFGSLEWTTSGDGSFDNPYRLNPIYIPGSADTANGAVSLYLKIYGTGACGSRFVKDTLMLNIWPLPAVNAGSDATICASGSFQAQGEAYHCSSILWTTSGDGWFSNPNSLNPIYYPGPQDRQNGSVAIIFKGWGNSFCSHEIAEDQLLLSLLPLPSVDAGVDFHVCEGASASLNATAAHYSSVLWYTAGDGYFSNTSILNPDYQPGPGDIQRGYMDLYVKVYGESLCANDTARDIVRIWIDRLPQLFAGVDDSICSNAIFMTQATALHAANFQWFTSSNGTFLNASQLNTTYFPGSEDIMNGYAILTLQASGTNACSQVTISDQIHLTLMPGPYAQAGSDKQVCASASMVNLTGIAGNYSQILWTSTGTGIFTDPSGLSTSYIMSPADKQAGNVRLVLHAMGTGVCVGEVAHDTLLVTIGPLPVANAGNDTSICSSENLQLFGAASNASAVSWSTSGDGTFDNPATTNPLYTPGPQDKSLGYVHLVFKSTGITPCQLQSSKDTLLLTIYPLPTASLSGGGTLCEGEPALLNVALTGTPPWTITYSNGNQSFTVNGILSSPYQWAVSPSSTTTYTLLGVHDANCTGYVLSGSVSVDVNPLPQPYLFVGSNNGAYCQGGQGSELVLTNSEIGVSYQLYRGSQILGTPVAGTGGAISFGYFTIPGDYFVRAFNTLTGCNREMLGHVQVNILSLPIVNVTTDTACLGNPTHFYLSGNNLGQITNTTWYFGDGDTAHYVGSAGTNHIYASSGNWLATVSVTDINGCTNTFEQGVYVQALPTSLFSFTYPGCKGEEIIFNNLAYTIAPDYISTWIWDFGDGSPRQTIIWPANPNTSHVYQQSGTYTVKLIVYTHSGCADSSTLLLTILPIPVVDFTWDNSCQHLQTQFTDLTQTGMGINPVSWQWNFGDPASGPANVAYVPNPQHIYNEPGTYYVSMEVMSNLGCSASVVKEVTVFPAPTAEFTYDTACYGQHTHFTDLSSSSSQIVSWEWDFGDGSAHSNLQNPFHLYALPGNYNVTLTITDATGCMDVVTHNIKVENLPYAAFTSSSPNCVGQTVNFASQSSFLQGYIVSWEWQFGDNTSQTIYYPNNPEVSHIYNQPGVYNATLIVTASNGCQASTTQVIHVQPTPLANFTFPANNCAQSAVQFTNTSLTNGGGPITNWYWNFGDPLSGNNNVSYIEHPAHLYNTAGTYDVMLVVTNGSGCSDTVFQQVTIRSRPLPSFTANPVCLGDITQFTNTSNPGNGTLVYYDWDFGDGSPHANISDPQHLYSGAGIYPVTLTIANSFGCQASLTQPVTVYQLPVSTFTVAGLQCEGAEVYFDDQSMAAQGYISQWNWDFGDGASAIINFPSVPDTTHVYNQAGIFSVNLTVTTNLGCSNTSSQVVNIQHAPVANFSFSNNCEGQAVLFTDLTQLNGGGALASWYWDFGDPSSGAYNNSTQQNPMHIFTGPGTFNVKLIVANINGCTDTIVKPVEVMMAPVAQFSADSVCLGNPTHFTDLSLPNASAITSWFWNFGDGYFSTQQNPEHTYSTWGEYTVSLSVVNGNGCQDDTTMLVLVKALPSSAFHYTGVCAGSVTMFTDMSTTPQGSIIAWEWQFGDGNTSTQQNPEHIYAAGGNYWVSLTVENSLGCTSSIQQNVNIYNAPSANFSAYSVFCPQGQVSFQNLSAGNGTPITWQNWNFGNGFSSTSPNPVYIYPVPDSCYNVTLVTGNAYGCVDTAIQQVCVKPGFAFTFEARPGCEGTPALFKPLNLAPGDSLQFVRWSFGDPTSGSLNQSTQYFAQHVYQKAGDYLVVLKAWNSDNCADSVIKIIHVLPPPVADFSYLENIPHCDTTITFGNQVFTYGAAIDSLIWSFGDGSVVRQLKPVAPTLTHRFPDYGTYWVTLESYIENRCMASVTKQVKVKCLTAAFSSDTVTCEQVPFTLFDQSGPSSSINHWL